MAYLTHGRSVSDAQHWKSNGTTKIEMIFLNFIVFYD